ncbi:PREDICTED: alanine--glyoxylate aminotransferase [Prunus dulcis]|uniref:PREDICTED: alanine--glyoxylate aminotransferase n=1 Tax=Prunus dulcis TaxID=3755 RepID=A0A5E4FQ49_PRUDU|nr:PREDICTED: alanine--glyoxylate aminotransferase [Prunus dulcis]
MFDESGRRYLDNGFGGIATVSCGHCHPDVVEAIVNQTMGIGNGIPLGAVVITPKVAEVLTRCNYFNTFGGNPVYFLVDAMDYTMSKI